MAATLKDLERRLEEVEQDVAFLRRMLLGAPCEETPAERGARLLREAKANQAALSAAWAKAMQEMGIEGEPIGAEKLQERIRASGVKPEDNAFSRGIIEMREE